MYYSDIEFTQVVNEKLGNVRYFKRSLRDYGLIGAQKQLSDEHIPLFEKVCETRQKDRSKWEEAMNKVLADHAYRVAAEASVPKAEQEDDEIVLLKEILKTQQKILNLLENKLK